MGRVSPFRNIDMNSYMSLLYKKKSVPQNFDSCLKCGIPLLLLWQQGHIIKRIEQVNLFASVKRLWQLCVTALLFSLAPLAAMAQSSESDEAAESVAEAEDNLIRLESRFIGDKEQPSVTYFVPWQGTDSPDDLKWKIERKNDDTLNLVDRDIMLRSMNIYNEMHLEKAN